MLSKECSKCKEEQPISEYYKSAKSGTQVWCKSCIRIHRTDWSRKNKEKVRWNTYWTKYRLRKEDYERILELQNESCAICENPQPTHVDHDHNCCPGVKSCGDCIRGILCNYCNQQILPAIEKDIDVIYKAIEYLSLNIK